ncbi:phage minor tail protein G [Rouxiella sp. S1S-2]|uniref:phage tail assembly chaperone G n=1 Tax=Rouxiella sp. S1S-2 TaxID=2653856 RepID=UPI001263ED33|nr:phage minor tail protein G [Rouxiella sp. S1S-2]KAB7896440.1 phage minor tail protein G [Rouxiella sp. S1S-2]
MFLKTEPFTFNSETVTLFELSALQRIEYLKYLAKDVQSLAQEEKEASILQAELVEKTIRSSAMLVAMSLWHNDVNGHSVQTLSDTLLSTWPVTALGQADLQVKRISGLIPEDDIQPVAEEAQTNVPAVSVEKSSPVS